MRLEELTYETCQRCQPPLREGQRVKVVRVVDGDTLIGGFINTEGVATRVSCRLRGIDSPELRSTVPEERELARQARERLRELVEGQCVTVTELQLDKYGRTLVKARFNRVDLSDYMLEDDKLCKKYE